LEEPASDKQNKNAKERTKKQLDKHLLVENEYGTGRASYGAKGCVKGCVDQFEDTESSDPLFNPDVEGTNKGTIAQSFIIFHDGKHGIATGWDDDVQH